MTPNQIDYEYFEWLTSQFFIQNGKSYGDLFEIMHNTEFIWIIPNDDNRVQDGLDLRTEFAKARRHELILEGVSVLEVLVALSRRVAFIESGKPEVWAWRLLKNLRLHRASDPLSEDQKSTIRDILYALIWRTYQPNGQGGFFPLKNPKEDQTKVEIWYQMNAYSIERHDS